MLIHWVCDLYQRAVAAAGFPGQPASPSPAKRKHDLCEEQYTRDVTDFRMTTAPDPNDLTLRLCRAYACPPLCLTAMVHDPAKDLCKPGGALAAAVR